MFDLTGLQQPIIAQYDGPAEGPPGTLDRRAAQFAAAGDYLDAARMAQRALKTGAASFESIVYYSVGVLLDGGMSRLSEVLEELNGRLARDFAAGPPSPRTQKRIDASLGWLFQTVGAQIAFHKARRDDVWHAWLSGCDDDLPERYGRHSAELRQRIQALLSRPLSPARLEALDAAVDASFCQFIASRRRDDDDAAPAEPAASGDGDPDESPAAEDEALRDDDGERAPSVPPRAEAPAFASPDDEASPLMVQLVRKLEAFYALIDGGDLARASIVAADIERIRGNFDPVLYLPRLFARYLDVLCRAGDDLMAHAANDESLSRQALQKLYEADIAAFLART